MTLDVSPQAPILFAIIQKDKTQFVITRSLKDFISYGSFRHIETNKFISNQTDELNATYIMMISSVFSHIISAFSIRRPVKRSPRRSGQGTAISNFDNRMDAFNAIMEQEIKPQIMQIECHPFAQRQETRKLAEQYNIQVECWYPLGHGDQRLLNAETLEVIAAAHDKSVVQIIIRWHIQEGFSVIPGSTNPDHIQENIEIFDFELTDEEMEQIRAMDQGESGRYFNLNYDFMGGMFTNPPREWDGEF